MYLEHINIRVPSIAKTQEFLGSAFPDFHVRGTGHSAFYGYWSHFGNSRTYIALLQPDKPGEETNQQVPSYQYDDTYRLMHVAYAVDDVDALIKRLSSHGHLPHQTDDLDSHPFRRRVYYLDGNGMEWEFIQYLSEIDNERNDYSL